ncbi:MAG TPA: LysM peptidoglycan-binding domain-containing protein [Steroidobacteraceae bacterium]|nr:LysM peptidoglycan-binding domain-containing protein [Steroidobacteraceae bacterium]
MFRDWQVSAARRAIFALAALSMIAGCSHTVPKADDLSSAEASAEAVDEADRGDEVAGKVDEADIGTLGPAQIENAMEALDQQTESEPRLVRPLGDNTAEAAAPDSDLFERIRKGFTLAEIDHEWIDREEAWFANHPDYLDRTFKRGERYLFHIVNEIEARKMPLELALLPVVESAFNPVAYSRARAAGLWQFIPATGKRFGLKQNWYYDGRRDVVAATSAALDYLEFLATEFDGDWLLAVAAYNTGEANVARAVAKNRAAGKPTDFFSLKLPKETLAYVPRLLAMKRIVQDPTAHGLAFAPIANQPYFAKVNVAAQIDLHVAAELAELPSEELLALNPAFNHWVTDPDGPFDLLVPVSCEAKFSERVAALPPEKRVRVVYHHVRRGDTLGAIADKYDVTVASIRVANKIRGNIIRPGQDLLISAAPTGSDLSRGSRMAYAEPTGNDRASSRRMPSGKHVVRAGDTLWSIARTHGISMARLAKSNGISQRETLSVGQVLAIPGTATLASTSSESVAGRAMTYVVRSGDTLSGIAHKFRVRLSDLLDWNNFSSRTVIRKGQRLVMYVDEGRRAGI